MLHAREHGAQTPLVRSQMLYPLGYGRESHAQNQRLTRFSRQHVAPGEPTRQASNPSTEAPRAVARNANIDPKIAPQLVGDHDRFKHT